MYVLRVLDFPSDLTHDLARDGDFSTIDPKLDREGLDSYKVGPRTRCKWSKTPIVSRVK